MPNNDTHYTFNTFDFKSLALNILGRFVKAEPMEGTSHMKITALDLERGRDEIAKELKKTWKAGIHEEKTRSLIIKP